MLGKFRQINQNPQKEKAIDQPVQVAQVAAAMFLQAHHLVKEHLKKKKKTSLNSYAINSDAEAQWLVQQQQALKLTKQKSPSKDTEGSPQSLHRGYN